QQYSQPCQLQQHQHRGERDQLRLAHLRRIYAHAERGVEVPVLRFLALFIAASLLAQAPRPPAGQQNDAPRPATFSTTTNLVVVDVTVSGRDGVPVTHLTKEDFLVYEDGKPQIVASCDLQKLESTPIAAQPSLKDRTQAPEPPKPAPQAVSVAGDAMTFQDRRLMVMFFDFSSMQPPEQIRAVDAAIKFLGTQMTASDMVSIMVFGSALKTVQDFTGDRDLLIFTIRGFHIGESSELASMSDTGADAEDQSGLYVADETEFNIFNTDRKLVALEDAACRLSSYPQKQALVYLSSGVADTDVDNQ